MKWNKVRTLFSFLLLCMAVYTPFFAHGDTSYKPLMASPRLLLEQTPAEEGAEFCGVLELPLAPSWHTYWKNPGDVGAAPQFSWTLPAGVSFVSLDWPMPKEFVAKEPAGMVYFGYEGTVRWLVTFRLEKKLSERAMPAVLSAHLSWIACSESACVPQEALFSADLVSQVLRQSEQDELQSALKIARLMIPREEKNVDAEVDQSFHHLTLHVPFEKRHALPPLVRDSHLFFDEEGLVKTADATVLFREGGEPYALQVTLQDGADTLLAKEKKVSGVYSYTLLEEGQKEAPRQVMGSFRDIAVQGAVSKSIVTTEEVPKKSVVEESSLISILLLAIVGGLLLNIMPCVLPVVGLKVLHLMSLSKKEGPLRRSSSFRYGLSFTAGVMASFWLLAFLLYGIQYFGSSVGWGFQLQEPWFVLALIVLLFAMSLSLFGMYEFGAKLGAQAASLEESAKEYAPSWITREHAISFISGFFVTLVATPCTGPFLGSVIGFLATIHPLKGLLIFSALGFGVALPYLFLSLFPGVLCWLPKPGRWMEIWKTILGFSLVITIVWLSWVLQSQVDGMSIASFLATLSTFAIGLWIWTTWTPATSSFLPLLVARSLSLCFFSLSLLFGMATLMPEKSIITGHFKEISWQSFSEERLQEALRSGKPVFVEVTAKWCLTCQVNKIVFLSPQVQHLFAKRGVVALEADWTKKDPAITAFLRRYGRNGVPVAIFFRKEGEEPTLLPEILTVRDIVTAIDVDDHSFGMVPALS